MFPLQVTIYLFPLCLWQSFIFILSWFRCNHNHYFYWSFLLEAKHGTGLLLNSSCGLELFRITEEELELNDRNCQPSLEFRRFHPIIMAESWLKEPKDYYQAQCFPITLFAMQYILYLFGPQMHGVKISILFSSWLTITRVPTLFFFLTKKNFLLSIWLSGKESIY